MQDFLQNVKLRGKKTWENFARKTALGIYDIKNNCGFACVGTSYDTPEFAVSSIEKWWCEEGRYNYPEKKKLLILADAGGSNGWRPRAWKYNLQKKRHIIDIHTIPNMV